MLLFGVRQNVSTEGKFVQVSLGGGDMGTHTYVGFHLLPT